MIIENPCATCALAEKHQTEMAECPIWEYEHSDECHGECAFYSEK